MLIYTTYVPCTMCSVCDTQAYYIGTGQRIVCLPGCSGTRAKKATRRREAKGGNCPGATRLRDYTTVTNRPELATAGPADEQGLTCPSLLLCCVIPRSHRQTSPCSHIHTHAHAHFGRVRVLDVKNTTLALLVPDYRQGSYPVPCRWKDEPG